MAKVISQAPEPWKRQPGESAKAYEAFTSYRNLGVERSITKVTQVLNKSRPLIGRWSSKWNWVERTRAWDNELDRQAKSAAIKRLKDMNSRHISIAIQLQKKALEALIALDSNGMEPKDIKEFIRLATELERTNRQEQAGFDKEEDDNGVQIIDDV